MEKNEVRREQLHEQDKTRYEIYDAIKRILPRSQKWNDLERLPKKQEITVRYKYCRNSDRKLGVLFGKTASSFRTQKSTDNSASQNRIGILRTRTSKANVGSRSQRILMPP